MRSRWDHPVVESAFLSPGQHGPFPQRIFPVITGAGLLSERAYPDRPRDLTAPKRSAGSCPASRVFPPRVVPSPLSAAGQGQTFRPEKEQNAPRASWWPLGKSPPNKGARQRKLVQLQGRRQSAPLDGVLCGECTHQGVASVSTSEVIKSHSLGRPAEAYLPKGAEEASGPLGGTHGQPLGAPGAQQPPTSQDSSHFHRSATLLHGCGRFQFWFLEGRVPLSAEALILATGCHLSRETSWLCPRGSWRPSLEECGSFLEERVRCGGGGSRGPHLRFRQSRSV